MVEFVAVVDVCLPNSTAIGASVHVWFFRSFVRSLTDCRRQSSLLVVTLPLYFSVSEKVQKLVDSQSPSG